MSRYFAFVDPEVSGEQARAGDDFRPAGRTPVTIPSEQPVHSEPAVSTFGEAAFKNAVLKAKEYIAVDSAFDAVVFRCATTHTDGNWITPEIANAYAALHRLGWAHSIEAWSAGRLVGGVYGVSIGGLFAGESMFHEATDASKVALAGLAAILAADGDSRRLIDVQWQTSHLATLGAVEIPRSDYLATLSGTLNAPPIRWNALANRPWRWTPDGLTGVSI